MKWSKLTFHLKSSSGGFSEHFSPSFASVSLSFWLLCNLLALLAQLCLAEVTLVCLAALLFISRVTCFEMLRCLFPPPAGSSSELSSSEAAPWLPRCAPTVHAERFIICELTMSPCRVERTEEAESGCAGQWVERETHGRASIEHHCTDDRHQPVLARPSPANTAPQIWPPCRSLAAEPAQPLELVGRWCRRCTVGFSLAARGSLFRQLAPLSHEQLQPLLDRTWHGLTVRGATPGASQVAAVEA